MDSVRLSELSGRLGMGEDHVVRDVLQARFMSGLFAQRLGSEIVLKGGLAMKTALGSERYTKDVDLQTGPGTSMRKVSSAVQSAISSALSTGLLSDAKVTAPKQTDSVQRWKINGKVGVVPVNMTVEVSRRGLPPPEHLAKVEFRPDPLYDLVPVMVDTYSPSAIAAGKVAALTSPNRTAPRDVWDLDVLIRSSVEPPVELLASMGPDAVVEALRELWSKLEAMPYTLARDALREYLPREVAAGFDEPAWEAMRLRTGEAVETWLQAAYTMTCGVQAGP